MAGENMVATVHFRMAMANTSDDLSEVARVVFQAVSACGRLVASRSPEWRASGRQVRDTAPSVQAIRYPYFPSRMTAEDVNYLHLLMCMCVKR